MVNSEINQGALFAGRYRLNRLVGRGSFGEVWHATDERTGIDVAVKIYIGLDDAGIKEFCSEFSSVHDLIHTNLLRPDYFDVDGSRPYLVMAYCPASSSKLVGSCSPETLRRFIGDVAAGLSYLHAAGIVHRDIKPDNVLCTTGGHFVITDFGLSRDMRATLRRNSRSVTSEQVSGSLSYMSPELFKAAPVHSCEADIWALGASAVEIATGELPFLGQGGVMQLHGAETPQLPDSIPDYLREIICRCLDPDPAARPTAADVVSMIEHPETITAKDEKTGKSNKVKVGKADRNKLKTTVRDNAKTTGAAAGAASESTGKKPAIIAAAVGLAVLLAVGIIVLLSSLPSSDSGQKTAPFEYKGDDPGSVFLRNNAKRDNVVTTASGLQYEIITDGDGPHPTAGSKVTVDYEGRLIDGTVFDKGTDATFPVSGVIPGFAEALKLMPLNSNWRVCIPSNLAYGENGVPGAIEPNAVLVFDIVLKKIEGGSSINPSTTPIHLTLAAQTKDGTCYITNREWMSLSDEEKAGYHKLGLTIIDGSHNFIISLKDSDNAVWADAKERHGSSLPTLSEVKIIERMGITVNELLQTFGGERFRPVEYWTGPDGITWSIFDGATAETANRDNSNRAAAVRTVKRLY